MSSRASPLIRLWLLCCALALAGEASARDPYPGRLYPVGGSPVPGFPADVVVATDLNGDGLDDVVGATSGLFFFPPQPGRLAVLLNQGDGTFADPVSHPVGDDLTSVAVADLDGDGAPDLVSADPVRSELNVLRGSGDGSFQAAVPFGVNPALDEIVLADLDGDGVPDLAGVGERSDALAVLLGNGDGSFRAAFATPVGLRPVSVAVADLDADGVPDLVTANEGSRDVSVLLGNGDGSFRDVGPIPIPEAALVRRVTAADLDGDGVPDLAVLVRSFQTSGVRVLLGNGDGSFRDAGSFPAGIPLVDLAIADLDGDGVPDLVAVHGGPLSPPGGGASVLRGRGDGSFDAAVTYLTVFPAALAVADIDADAAQDLLVAGVIFGFGGAPVIPLVQVVQGHGDGTFPAPAYPPGRRPEDIAAADLDGDGLLDLVTADAGHFETPGGISVLLNNGDRSFRHAFSLGLGTPRGRMARLAAGDLDGDGVPDVVVKLFGFGDSVFAVLRGRGDGSFEVAGSIASFAEDLALADLDNDGALDLVVGAGNVAVLLGRGDGTFQDPVSLPAGTRRAPAIADLDGDGFLDVVVIDSRRSVSLSVFLGNGDGSFQDSVPYQTGRRESSIAIADLDGDGALDLVTDLSVLRGLGDGSFLDAVGIEESITGSIVLADVDGDSIPDLLNHTTEGLLVLLGNGDASFQPPLSFWAGGGGDMVVADLDGDGLPDVATANVNEEIVGVLFHLGEALTEVAIDIKPGNPVNPINPMSRGVIPVALLGSEDFDVREVDLCTLAFGPGGAAPLGGCGSGRGRPLVSFLGDVNRDGFRDLIARYPTEETGIAFGQTEACLRGELVGGGAFEGCDAIRTVPACGIGFELAALLPGLWWLHRRRTRSAAAR